MLLQTPVLLEIQRNAEKCREIQRNAETCREMQRNSEKCRGGEYSQRLHQTLLFVNCLLPGYRILCYAWDHLVEEMSAISFRGSKYFGNHDYEEKTLHTLLGAVLGVWHLKWLEICVGRLLYSCKFSFTINVLKICDHRPTLEWGSGNLENWPMIWAMAGSSNG